MYVYKGEVIINEGGKYVAAFPTVVAVLIK